MEKAGWPEWAGTRRPTVQVRRRKAVVEVSLPGSSHSSPSAGDPNRPLTPSPVQRQVSELSRHPDQGLTGKTSALAAVSPRTSTMQQIFCDGGGIVVLATEATTRTASWL